MVCGVSLKDTKPSSLFKFVTHMKAEMKTSCSNFYRVDQPQPSALVHSLDPFGLLDANVDKSSVQVCSSIAFLCSAKLCGFLLCFKCMHDVGTKLAP